MRIRILGTNLPGRSFGEHSNVHVGLQRRDAPIHLVAGDASEAVFDFSVEAADGDFRGPYVKGRRGERFVYLTWGEVDAGNAFTMFRRAKLHLSAVPPAVVAAALAPGAVLEGSLALTDGSGGPRCASVHPPLITWRAVQG